MENKQSCLGCHFLDGFDGEYYCILSQPDLNEDGFCNSYITNDDFNEFIDSCPGKTMQALKSLKYLSKKVTVCDP